MTSSQFATDGTIGVDLDELIAGTGTSSDEGNQHSLGQTAQCSDGCVYMYVHASAAIALYKAVAVDENFEAAPLTTALAQAGHMVGWAQIAFSDNDFGWVVVKGANFKGQIGAACAPDTQLYTSGTAGVLDDDSSTVYEPIIGPVILATATGTITDGDEILCHTFAGSNAP